MFGRKKSEFGREGYSGHFWEIVARSADQASKREGGREFKMGRGGPQRESGAHYNYSLSHVGVHRKAADQFGRTRWFLTRLWVFVVILSSLALLASVSPIGNSIQVHLFYPKKLVLSNPRDPDSSARLLWERRTEQMFAVSFNALRHHPLGDASQSRPRSLTSTLSSDELKRAAAASTSSIPFIEDLVSLPEDQDLFIVRHGFSVYGSISACSYGNDLKSVPLMVDFLSDLRLTVTCMRPSALRTQKVLKAENVSLDLNKNDAVDTPLLPYSNETLKPVRWDEALVYAVQSTDVDVILYVKNVFETGRKKASEYTELENFRCLFGEVVETPVTAGALEVFRCETPRFNSTTTFPTGVKVHLLYKNKTIPSVAYYEPIRGESSLPMGNLEVVGGHPRSGEDGVKMPPKKKYLVCSCTMIWNVAKFLNEWVLFNSDLGVEKFFLYDNNSEDDIVRVVSGLSDYNVTRRSWPWVKTQEAGFSHCAVEAQRECTWILFTDVDEYLFPKRWLQLTRPLEAEEVGAVVSGRSRSPLASLIADTTGTSVTLPGSRPPPSEVGQISFQCRNFGPSGRTTNPSNGVTQGYTCRDQREQRHKSMVYFPALKSSLQNVIHHFQLKPRYRTVNLDVPQAVVQHYKYQAWSEFETKFTKRASTYVVDWKEPKNLNSRDRPEGLGISPKKPLDWETSHCDVKDTALRDYTRRRFGVLGRGYSLKMAWEL